MIHVGLMLPMLIVLFAIVGFGLMALAVDFHKQRIVSKTFSALFKLYCYLTFGLGALMFWLAVAGVVWIYILPLSG